MPIFETQNAKKCEKTENHRVKHPIERFFARNILNKGEKSLSLPRIFLKQIFIKGKFIWICLENYKKK